MAVPLGWCLWLYALLTITIPGLALAWFVDPIVSTHHLDRDNAAYPSDWNIARVLKGIGLASNVIAVGFVGLQVGTIYNRYTHGGCLVAVVGTPFVVQLAIFIALQVLICAPASILWTGLPRFEPMMSQH